VGNGANVWRFLVGEGKVRESDLRGPLRESTPVDQGVQANSEIRGTKIEKRCGLDNNRKCWVVSAIMFEDGEVMELQVRSNEFKNVNVFGHKRATHKGGGESRKETDRDGSFTRII